MRGRSSSLQPLRAATERVTSHLPNFVMMYRACVEPRSRDLALRMLMCSTVLYPIDRFVSVRLCEIQRSRRFVTTSEPRSPLLPFVSSTELILSILYSPDRVDGLAR